MKVSICENCKFRSREEKHPGLDIKEYSCYATLPPQFYFIGEPFNNVYFNGSCSLWKPRGSK